MHRTQTPFTGGHGIVAWVVVTVLAVLILPLLPYAFIDDAGGTPAVISVPNPGADLWREVRQRDTALSGSTQVRGVDTGVLINSGGEEWREFRRETLIPYSAWIFGALIVGLFLYLILRGRIRIKAGRSGVRIPRYSVFDRTVHWVMVAVFLTLALTGLILLYGRFVLIPLLGPEGFGATAQASKLVHDIAGPVFIVTLVLMTVSYFREALIDWKVDTKWVLRAGGYLGGAQPSSGKINAGQKAWYWTVVLGGLLLVASGLVMYFPNFEQGRFILQASHVVHSLAAVFVIAFLFLHIYLGSIGMEGSMENMIGGYCDENWAKQEHKLWYEEMKAEGKVGASFDAERKPSASEAAVRTAGT
jgi:formate dehydrogenase subunit gamma